MQGDGVLHVPGNPLNSEWTVTPSRTGYSQIKGKSFFFPFKAHDKFYSTIP